VRANLSHCAFHLSKILITGYNTQKSGEHVMLNPKKLEEIAKQITESVPPGIKQFAEGFEDKIKQILQRKLVNMDFVSREEFDVQTQVLQRTREKLDALEKQVNALEQAQVSNQDDK
jgi:BMFP domain-containing protein YqiC